MERRKLFLLSPRMPAHASTSCPKVHSLRYGISGCSVDRFLHGVVGKDHAARRIDRSHIATAGVRSHPAVSRLLFGPIAQMEGLGIAPRKGLDLGCAGLTDRLVALQCVRNADIRHAPEAGC